MLLKKYRADYQHFTQNKHKKTQKYFFCIVFSPYTCSTINKQTNNNIMKAQRRYWLSNDGCCLEANTLSQVKVLIEKNLPKFYEDGYACGGYTLCKANGDSVVSFGTFWIVENKIKYLAEFIEIQ